MENTKTKALKSRTEMGPKAKEIYHNAPSHNTTMKSVARKFVRGDSRSASLRRRQDRAYERMFTSKGSNEKHESFTGLKNRKGEYQ